ncbi:hypothetical protein ACIQ9P_18805 [Kitasatospora sp. NPDC094019]|uniref:hypothetical protein n=1 Tax=Kitasatospora sp. NPDC094019 TaxID=3364091 RepID=UPI00382BD65A
MPLSPARPWQPRAGLRLLVERMGDLGWRMQDHHDEDLLNIASALRGTAILIALDTEDLDLHEEVTGRRVHEVHDVAEWLREHGEGDGRPLPCRPGPVAPAAGDDPQDGAGGSELAEVESGVAPVGDQLQQAGGVVGERRRLGAGDDGLQDGRGEPDGVQDSGPARVDAAGVADVPQGVEALLQLQQHVVDGDRAVGGLTPGAGQGGDHFAAAPPPPPARPGIPED